MTLALLHKTGSEFFQPDIAHEDFAGTFNFKTDQAALAEFRGVVIDEDRHHMSVDNVGHGGSAGDDVKLIPIVDFYIAAEFVLVAKGRQKARAFALCGLNHLPSPGDDAAAGGLF